MSSQSPQSLPVVHVLFENPDWLPPLVSGLEAEGFPVRLVEVDSGSVDPASVPPEGIWLNRVSPSSHTRGHLGTVALARELLYWLESHGRRVVNGLGAFEVEMSKLRQDLILRRHGILTPRTVLAVGREALLAQAATFDGPFITKHNQGGKGLGIQLFSSPQQLSDWLEAADYDPGPEGKVILQQYIQAPKPYITRVEIVGDRMVLAMRSATDEGFQLCPSDACQIPASNPDVCPIDGEDAGPTSKFSPADLSPDDPLVQKYIRMCKAEGIEIAGIEYIEDAEGRRYTYDINGTTNYSGVLGRQIGVDGMREVARYLKAQVAA